MKLFDRKRGPEPAPLTPRTIEHIEALFSEDDQEAAASLLTDECGRNLPMLEKSSPVELERFRFAALKLSRGSLSELREAIALAKTDWRDLLVAADFAVDIDAHESWNPGEPAD